jgi:heme-degrading monooxygenase HmoA
MFVALSRFTIRNDMADEVRQAFVSRPHLVDKEHGFLGMQVMNPIENPAEFWLVTRWTDEQSYRIWHKSHAYHESHSGIPKGLKLVPDSVEIRLFKLFAE